jgi:hypothetical protein
MEYPMKRAFLLVIAAGGMMAISAYAAVQKDAEANDATHSVDRALPHMAEKRITLIGISRGRQDGTQTYSPSEEKLFDAVLINPNLLAKKGNFCNTNSGGCPQIPEKKVGSLCKCPDNTVGRVTTKRPSPIMQAPAPAKPNNDKSKNSDSTDSNINKNSIIF